MKEKKEINKITTYPNQKTVKVTLADMSDPKSIYAKTRIDVLFYAIDNLKPSEFKVFLYLGSNQDGYEMALSPQDIVDKCGGNKRNIQQAINGLIEKGYLIPDSNKKNYYTYVQKEDSKTN